MPHYACLPLGQAEQPNPTFRLQTRQKRTYSVN
jgi:hypothetical protein